MPHEMAELGQYAFLDVESSGLHVSSYPIEIGWAFPTPDILTKSFLIRPMPSWTHWSATSQGVHGIPRRLCARDGLHPRDVARMLNDDLAGKIVVSDATGWDGRWLRSLYDAAGMDQAFALVDDSEVLRAGIDNLDLPAVDAYRAYTDIRNAAEKVYPYLHRAGPDAAHYAAIFRALMDVDFRVALLDGAVGLPEPEPRI